jgi:protein phosphatase
MDSDGERLEVGALSETGYTREENQDRMSGAQVPLGHLYIVADGMGGHKGGALAAQMAVEELQRHIGQAAAGESADSVIEAAFKAANDTVYQRANSGDSAVEGMGTTAVLLLISGRIAKLAHVGDSRAYLYRNHTLSQLTTDHTIVQRMVEAGMLKPDEIADHPQSSVLERAIGSAPTVGVDIYNHQLQEDDVLLLCSDGLSGYVTADQIEAVLRTDRPVQETTVDLVRLALETGGKDNVTVQLIRYGARKLAAPPAQTRPVNALPLRTPTVGGGPARHERGLISQVAAFVIAGTLAGVTTAGFLVHSIESRKTETVNQLKEDLGRSNSAREQALEQIKALQQRLDAAPPLDKTTHQPPPAPTPLKPKVGGEPKEAKKLTPPSRTPEKLRQEPPATKPAKEDSGKRAEELQQTDKGTQGSEKETQSPDKGMPSSPTESRPSNPQPATAPGNLGGRQTHGRNAARTGAGALAHSFKEQEEPLSGTEAWGPSQR